MEFRILGPLEVWKRGAPVELRQQRQRALLAALLLRAGQIVSVDQLLDDLWGERAPPTAKGSLQNAVSALRKLLGAEVLRTQAPGYLLDVEQERVDLFRFERLLAEARSTPNEAERAEKLRRALALWRGPPLADLAFQPFALLEAPRLEDLHMAAREELIEARLALGEHAELLPELEALAVEHPFDERLRGQLMLALYRAGRQVEALGSYRKAREFFVEELGLEPSAPLRELEQAILRHDPTLSPAPMRLPVTLPMRKTATVLFAPLVGSGGLRAQSDPEALSRLLDRHFAAIRAAVERHGGTVERFLNDVAVAIFGVPKAHEDDALRALRAALELRDEFPGVGDELGLPIGVNTGEVYVSDSASAGLVTGAVLDSAKRLAEAASPGEILLAASTVRLVRSTAITEALEPLGVGVGRPLGAWRLLGLIEGAPAIPRRLEAPLVGRGEELARLRHAFEAARHQSACRLVVLVGEPGIGKTRLAGEFVSEVDGEALVLIGRCVSYGQGATWLPLAEIVREAGAETSEALRVLLSAEPDGQLIASRVAGAIGVSEEPTPLEETNWAIRRLFEALAREQPLLLVFEDVHWAEQALLDLIEYLGERASGPILVLCLTRPELLETRTEWTERAITLAALTEADLQALLDALPADLEAGARARVVELAEGNPLFAEQLVAHVQEEGLSSLEVAPPSIEALLASRLDLLPAEDRALLQRAAVIGRQFSRVAVLKLSADDSTSTEAQLRSLTKKGFVRIGASDSSLGFHHVLVRDVAYAGIPKSERAELHERFAGCLEERRAGLVELDEILGYHLEQAAHYKAELGRPDPVLAQLAGERLAAAGRRGLWRGDGRAACSLLARALEMTRPLRFDVLLELDLACAHISNAPEQAVKIAEAAARRAREAGDEAGQTLARLVAAHQRIHLADESKVDELEALARIALPVYERTKNYAALVHVWMALCEVAICHGRFDERANVAERALAHTSLAGQRARFAFALGIGLVDGPRPADQALRVLDKAVPEKADPPSLVGRALLLAMLGRHDEASTLAQEANARLQELGAMDGGGVIANVARLAGDDEAAARSLRKFCEWLEQHGHRSMLSTYAPLLGHSLCGLDRYEEAEKWAELGRELGETGDHMTQSLWRQVKALVHSSRGEHAEARRLVRDAVAIAEQTDSLNLQGDALCDLATILRAAGCADEGGAALEQALERGARKRNLAMVERVRAKLA